VIPENAGSRLACRDLLDFFVGTGPEWPQRSKRLTKELELVMRMNRTLTVSNVTP
jgi:hypothetical protein